MDLSQILIILGGSSVIGAIIAAIAGRGKNKADAAATLLGASAGTVASLRAEVEAVQADVKELREEIKLLRAELRTEERRTRAAARYIGQLLDLIRRHAPDASVPDPPAELDHLGEWIGHS